MQRTATEQPASARLRESKCHNLSKATDGLVNISSILEILSRPRRPYRGHLVVELRQGGVRCEVGGVTLEQLQLFIKPVFILFAAVPAAAHGPEQDLAGLAPPLQNHHLGAMNTSAFSTKIEYDLRKAMQD